MTITQQADNTLLHRTEITGTIAFTGSTPSNKEVAEEIAKKTKKDTSLIVMKNIYTSFGHQQADFEALAYENQESMNRTEKVTKHIKKKLEENKKKAAEEKKTQEETAAKVKEESTKEETKAPSEEKTEKISEKEEPKQEKTEETTSEAEEKKEGEA